VIGYGKDRLTYLWTIPLRPAGRLAGTGSCMQTGLLVLFLWGGHLN